ncbi:MAG: peroxiredoxin family protein, partial [Planctomycetota bacterium]
QFPVLSDVESAVSKTWGVYEPETEEKPELMNHGTFIVDRTGKVIWAEMGKEPFLDNKTLLHVIARSQGLLPSSTPVAQNSGLPQP